MEHRFTRLATIPGEVRVKISRATGGTKQVERITRDPNRLGGQPCIRDLRITVRRALQVIALYPDRDELRREYPELEDEDLRQALEFAAAQMEDRSIELPAAS